MLAVLHVLLCGSLCSSQPYSAGPGLHRSQNSHHPPGQPSWTLSHVWRAGYSIQSGTVTSASLKVMIPYQYLCLYLGVLLEEPPGLFFLGVWKPRQPILWECWSWTRTFPLTKPAVSGSERLHAALGAPGELHSKTLRLHMLIVLWIPFQYQLSLVWSWYMWKWATLSPTCQTSVL